MSDDLQNAFTEPTPDGGASFEERFTTLEASNVSLAADIRALTTTLKVVNELQVEQRAQARRVEDTEKVVSSNKSETDERLARTRRSVNVATLAMAILLPVVSIIVYLVLIDHVNDLLDENSSDRRAACENRNAGTQADVDRERLLAQIEDDPMAKKIHSDSATEIAKSKIDCTELYRRK